jgi:tetratricopeptide (TPR) repeat protein
MSVKLNDGKGMTATRQKNPSPSSSHPEQPPLPDVRQLVRGRYVALAGRLASMTRDDFVELVEAHGGRLASGGPAAGVALVVIGQKDWLLSKDGLLNNVLRQARVMQRRRRAPLVVMSEEQLLASLGLERQVQGVHQLYTTPTLCEVLGVAPGRIRAWVKAGLIRPAETRDGAWHFDFRQVSAAKTLCDLARSGVTLARLRRSLEQLQTWLPEAEQPLQQLALLENGQFMVRLEDGELAEADGQLHLDFEQQRAGPASEAGAMAASGAAPMRLHAGPATAAQWYEQAIEQQAAGYLADAVESYRQALMIGGPDADVCFDLAHALAAMGKRERAAERYAQALELRPRFLNAWNNLGMVLAELGQHDEACAAFRRALEIDPSDLRAHYNLADTLDEMGFGAQAAPHWRAYLRQDRTSQWADYARQRLGAVS